MRQARVWQYRVARALGRFITRIVAILTFGRMPPFVSTSALVTNGDQVLVVLDPVRNEPILPGGHLTWREKPEDAVVREAREETGYVIQPLQLLGVFTGPEWAGEAGVVRIVYTATVASGELASSPEGEAVWMSVSNLVQSDTRDAPVIRYWLRNRDSLLTL